MLEAAGDVDGRINLWLQGFLNVLLHGLLLRDGQMVYSTFGTDTDDVGSTVDALHGSGGKRRVAWAVVLEERQMVLWAEDMQRKIEMHRRPWDWQRQLVVQRVIEEELTGVRRAGHQQEWRVGYPGVMEENESRTACTSSANGSLGGSIADSMGFCIWSGLLSGLEKTQTDSVTSQAIFEIRLRGPGISVHSPPVRFVPGTPYVYEVHGCGTRTPQNERHASTELFGRLADSSAISLSAHRTHDRFTRSPREFGSQCQLDEELSVTQSEDIFPGTRIGLAVHDSQLSPQRAVDIQRTANSFRCGASVPLKKFQKMLGLMASASSVLQLGLLRMRPLQFWLKARVPRRAWASGLLRLRVNQKCVTALKPWRSERLVPIRCKPGDFLEGESGVHGRVHLGMGSAARGQTVLGPVVGTGEAPAHKLPRNAGSRQRADAFLSPNKRTPRPGPFGQHVCGVLHKSPGRPQVQEPVQAGRTPPGMGSVQPALAQSSARARAPEYRTRQTVQEQCSGRRMVSTPTDSPTAVEEIRQSGSRPVRVSRKRSLSGIFLQEQGRAGPCVAPPPALCFSPRLSPASGDRADQGRRMLSIAGGTVLGKPTLVPSRDAVSKYCPVASTSEGRPPLTGPRLDLASSPGIMVHSCLGHQRVHVVLPKGVLNTITQARAPFTRRLYSSKWSGFSGWCTARGVSPTDCGVTEVLSFLQELLDKGRAPSTLKVYVAAIAAFSGTTLGQSIGRNDLVIRFLRGAKRLNPPRPPSVPVWDLSTVLEAMKGAPFEPLQSIDLKHLSFKTVFLLALASVKRIGDLHALSVSAACMEFGPKDSKVILKPKHGYVPKSLNTAFRAQVISLSALSVPDEERDASLLCPVRALRAYVSRSSVFRQTEQLFVSFSGHSKGLAASKQSLSRWIVDAIVLAYASKGMQCPLGVRAHSTRGMASSWAWSSGIALQDICMAAGWASPSTFIRFYNLEVPALQARLLSV
ncbi:hypothetical protein PO909_014706 [Leuciscus waleckii]